MSESNSARFRREQQERDRLARRAPLPAGSRKVPSRPTPTDTHTLELRGFLQGKDRKLGDIGYQCGNANTLQLPWLAGSAPELFAPVPGIGDEEHPRICGMPRLLIIHSFYSSYEHVLKGIGSALLRAMVQLCEQNDCQYVVVMSGINHEVYSAFGFDMVDDFDTWCISLTKLRHRLARPMPPLAGRRRASAEALF